jgi:hypothetical protein
MKTGALYSVKDKRSISRKKKKKMSGPSNFGFDQDEGMSSRQR